METTHIRVGDYVKGNMITSSGEIKSFKGFIDFIARSHVQLSDGFIVPLIPQKFLIEKVPNIVSLKYWRQDKNKIVI